jgi:uncharacterized HAD superfamily protein
VCCSCGCRRVRDSHQDARHVVLDDLQNAALVAGIPLELVAQNIQQAVAQQDPARAFLAQVSKPRVVCDIDGTLAERDLCAVCALNARFGTAYTYESITSPHAKDWIDDEDALDWYKKRRHDPVFLGNLAPYQDAQWALWSLRQGGYHVTVSSDREAELEGISKAWLDQWGIGYDDVQVGEGMKAKLAAEASAQQPVAFFDDNPNRAADLPGPYATVYLLDRPWNRSAPESPYVIRVRTWPEVLSHFPAVQMTGAVSAS